jgi:hypothetical protein
MKPLVKPDVARELSRLKNFQRDTVEHIFSRMYDPVTPTRRFLVADEVGLGKTLVARGLVAKVVDQLWDSIGRIDIIYICSNGSIARQNINRLNVSDEKDATLPSRITLLPTVVRGLKGRKLNFISLTPQTSFDLRSSLGTYEERALLYWLLPDDWKTSPTAVQNLLQGGADRDSFRWRVSEFERDRIDPELHAAFVAELAKRAEIKEEFLGTADRFQTWRKNLPEEDRAAQRQVVGKLRLELATSCLGALEPDLIILDEFQRFKHLLDGTDQSSDLAQRLFTFQDARVLLLSATPYKMYTLADECETDDHFRDFVKTIAFLHNDESKTAAFRTLLDQYRNGVFSLGSNATGELAASKGAIERELRQVMVRTERLAVSADRNGMLTEVPSSRLQLRADDVTSFVAHARIAASLDHSDVGEYWKSAPYLLNFMDDYEFKESFERAGGDPQVTADIAAMLVGAPGALLSWDDVERYRALDPANARLRHLVADVTSQGLLGRLWLPAALPYYSSPLIDDNPDAVQPTKRLIFSSWQVVPKVVAALLSYEAERVMFGDRPEIEKPNTAEGRERVTQLLRFARSGERLTGMPMLTLFYPSITLAEMGDPLEWRRSAAAGRLPSHVDVLRSVADRLRAALSALSVGETADGPADESWYWAGPILLDLARYPSETSRWFRQENLADLWRGEEESDAPEESETEVEGWVAHVAELVRAASGHVRLGPQPEDLADVLAQVAIGAPGVVSLRALSRICGGPDSLRVRGRRNHAGQIAWGFRSLFNLPEVTTMLRREAPETPYWRHVLNYCVTNGLQAVADEYLHMLQEWEGVGHRAPGLASKTVAERAAQSLQLRTAAVGVDEISVDGAGIHMKDRRMRARFAARFGARQIDEGAGAVRADDVRSAFNSPFWPFVLCSTSVGQEGLDFHLYCHAVVHWNLPSNPVDLEQREGRVHRFKGHAIRKNAARLYGERALSVASADPWDAVFAVAEADRPAGSSDLVPYWILAAVGGATIERHILSLPLSRDVDRADALRKSLTVYRMAFGQNRQDDLIAYLTNRFPAEEISRIAEMLRINLAPAPVERNETAVGWERPMDGPDADEDIGFLRSVSFTLADVDSLLDEFVALQTSTNQHGIEPLRDLLDQYVALKA